MHGYINFRIVTLEETGDFDVSLYQQQFFHCMTVSYPFIEIRCYLHIKCLQSCKPSDISHIYH